MSTVPIYDAEVRWTVLKYFVGLIEIGEIEPLLQCGMSSELLEALRTRSMADISRIAKDTSIGFEIKINAPQFNSAFVRLDEIMRDQQMLEYYIQHQLPSALLARMFKKHSRELRDMRAALCGPERETVGRPSLPDIDVREAIHAAWNEIGKTVPERRQFYELHQRFPDHPLNQLWSVVNEFGDMNPPTSRPPRATVGTGR